MNCANVVIYSANVVIYYANIVFYSANIVFYSANKANLMLTVCVSRDRAED